MRNRHTTIPLATFLVSVTAAAVLLLLRPDSEPSRDALSAPVATAARTASAAPRPATTASLLATPAPAPAASATPWALPPATPTPPNPGVLTLTPSSGVPAPTPAPPREPPIPYARADADAATPGSYALLAASSGATHIVETYEELRTQTTVARLHVLDANGISQAERYDAVAVGDLIEWRAAEDCWTRFLVTSVHPAGGATREFGVRWMSYAFTGCSGALPAGLAATLDPGPLPDLGNPRLAYPVRHGPWQLVPGDWTGDVEDAPAFQGPWRFARDRLPAATLHHARQLPHWRDPALPIGWTLQLIERESASPHWAGYRAAYGTTTGLHAFTVSASYGVQGGERVTVECALDCHEARVIAGRPARVSYTPPGPFVPSVSPVTVTVYDPESRTTYTVQEGSGRLLGGRAERAIAIARSLFETAPAPPGALRYGHLDRLGAAAEPGSYAFLSGAGGAVSTTYGDLRDGSADRLLIHTSDVDGVSHRDTLEALQAGDHFEWWRSETCWVRFRVTEALPGPGAAGDRRLLGAAPEDFDATGCNGPIPPDAYSYLDPEPDAVRP